MGAITTDKDTTGGTGPMISMQPFLSVAETTPFISTLELFYESSLQGKVTTLNSLINAQYLGIVAIDGAVAADFPESVGNSTQIGSNIIWKDGSGTAITNNALLTSPPEIISAFRASDVSQSNNVANLFQLVYYGGPAAQYQLKTNSYFWFQQTSAANPSSDVYNITFQTTYTPAAETFVDETTYTATLTNVLPSFTTPGSCPLTLTGITESTSTIFSFAAVNGSNASGGNSTSELIFSLDPTNLASVLNGFSITPGGVLTANAGTLVDLQSWSIKVSVTDANGDGSTRNCTVNFTVGIDPVPKYICVKRQGAGGVAECGENVEYQFFEADTTLPLPSSSTVPYPAGYGGTLSSTAIIYNVRAAYNAASISPTATTGALTQGKMRLTTALTKPSVTPSTSVTMDYTVQYRVDASAAWSTAQLADGAGIFDSRQQIAYTPSDTTPSVTQVWEFDTPGEYRLITDLLGGACVDSEFSVQFEDGGYPGAAC